MYKQYGRVQWNKAEYLQNLFDINDIVLLQEHWLFDRQSHLLEDCVNNVNSYCVSGMDNDDGGDMVDVEKVIGLHCWAYCVLKQKVEYC